jgi:hypothetical protein
MVSGSPSIRATSAAVNVTAAMAAGHSSAVDGTRPGGMSQKLGEGEGGGGRLFEAGRFAMSDELLHAEWALTVGAQDIRSYRS